MRTLPEIARFARTVRHLRPVQVLDRLRRRLVLPARLPMKAPPLRAVTGEGGVGFLPRPVSILGGDRFRFLNTDVEVRPDKVLDARPSLLWDYHLNYFDGLLSPETPQELKVGWLRTWLDRVPAGTRPAWDPYPLSRRVLSWVKWAETVPDEVPEDFDRSLAGQASFLARTLEYHLLANHLLANAVGLVAVGCRLGGSQGDRWLAKGLQLLEAELQEQFLADGCHYERSPAYHALILEDLLDLVVLLRRRDLEVSGILSTTIPRAAEWLDWVRRPDGRIPLLNDAAYGMASTAGDVLHYAERSGFDWHREASQGVTCRSSGLVRYRWGRLAVLADVAEVGPAYQPGHTHCDMLSFVLSWNGAPVLVDTGTSTYEAGPRRSWERGTAAHNTVQLGDLEQSEIWAAFRMGRRATVESVRVEAARVSASIRAFPPAWAQVDRTWDFVGESVRIQDRVATNRAPDSEPPVARFHFHPDVRLSRRGGVWSAAGMKLEFTGAAEVRPVQYQYAPEFNRTIAATCLEVPFDGELETDIGPCESSS